MKFDTIASALKMDGAAERVQNTRSRFFQRSEVHITMKLTKIICARHPSPLSLHTHSIFCQNIKSTRQLYSTAFVAHSLWRLQFILFRSFFLLGTTALLCQRLALAVQVLVSFLRWQMCAHSLCITKHKVISFVMENRFNSRKNENALAAFHTSILQTHLHSPTLTHTNDRVNTRVEWQKGLLHENNSMYLRAKCISMPPKRLKQTLQIKKDCIQTTLAYMCVVSDVDTTFRLFLW